MAAISEDHYMTDHEDEAEVLQSKIKKTQKDYIALNAMMNGMDSFDRYTSFSNLMCRFVLLGTHSKNGITLAAVQGGGFVWLSMGIVGAALAVIGAAVDHGNRKKALEETLAECEAVLHEIDAYQEKNNIDDPLSNIELLQEILKKGVSPNKRKIRRMLAAVLGKSPYDIDFEALKIEFESASGTENDDQEYEIDFDIEPAPKKKVTAKQVVSYSVNFIASFGTGAGFVYWGAFMFGTAVPFGWALILAGVLVGIVVGTIFMVQQIRMEHMHQPLDEKASGFLQSLLLNKTLQKQLTKLNKQENNHVQEIAYEKVDFSEDYVAEGREHLYNEQVPSARKHMYRAGMIGYNAVLGFVIGFGLVMTFAFITGGTALIPCIIVGLIFGAYFIYTGADHCATVEREEIAKRTELRNAQIDFRTHWEHHQSVGYNPEDQLQKTVPVLLFEMVKTFGAQDIKNQNNTKYRHQKKVLNLIAKTANIPLNYTATNVSEDFFDALYAYLLKELADDIKIGDYTHNDIKNAVLSVKRKVMGDYKQDVKEPHYPETFFEKVVDWAKRTFTRENLPNGIKRTFAILGILTLGAAIPFMAMSGGILLPVALGLFMAAVLVAYIFREVMEYKRTQEFATMDDELQKFEVIDRTRKLMKPDKYADLRAAQENTVNEQEDLASKNKKVRTTGFGKEEKAEKNRHRQWFRCFPGRKHASLDDEGYSSCTVPGITY